MNSGKRTSLALFAAFAMLASNSLNDLGGISSTPERRKKSQVIPKGTDSYYFDTEGNRVWLEKDSVYSCIASNLRNAKRKFDKWKERYEQGINTQNV